MWSVTFTDYTRPSCQYRLSLYWNHPYILNPLHAWIAICSGVLAMLLRYSGVINFCLLSIHQSFSQTSTRQLLDSCICTDHRTGNDCWKYGNKIAVMFIDIPIVWWRHDMEMLFALAVLSLENHQWPLDFLTKGHCQAVFNAHYEQHGPICGEATLAGARPSVWWSYISSIMTLCVVKLH